MHQRGAALAVALQEHGGARKRAFEILDVRAEVIELRAALPRDGVFEEIIETLDRVEENLLEGVRVLARVAGATA